MLRIPQAVVDNRANVVARPTRSRFVQSFQFSEGYVTHFFGALGSLTLEPGCYIMNGTLLVEKGGGDTGTPGETPTQGAATARWTENTMTPWDPGEGPITGQMWWGFDDGRDSTYGQNRFFRRSIQMTPTPCELLTPDTVSIIAQWDGDAALLIGVISALRIPPLEY